MPYGRHGVAVQPKNWWDYLRNRRNFKGTGPVCLTACIAGGLRPAADSRAQVGLLPVEKQVHRTKAASNQATSHLRLGTSFIAREIVMMAENDKLDKPSLLYFTA